jgi:beta-glucosidase
MKKLKFSSYVYAALMLALSLSSCKNWSETGTGSLRIITNKDGQTLGYDTTSGVEILTVRRLGAEERAKDLASKMTVEQIAGLMLYSAHQAIPSGSTRFGASTYKGKPFPESGAKSFDLSDQQIKFLTKDNLRHVLITSVESPVYQSQCRNQWYSVNLRKMQKPYS